MEGWFLVAKGKLTIHGGIYLFIDVDYAWIDT